MAKPEWYGINYASEETRAAAVELGNRLVATLGELLPDEGGLVPGACLGLEPPCREFLAVVGEDVLVLGEIRPDGNSVQQLLYDARSNQWAGSAPHDAAKQLLDDMVTYHAATEFCRPENVDATLPLGDLTLNRVAVARSAAAAARDYLLAKLELSDGQRIDLMELAYPHRCRVYCLDNAVLIAFGLTPSVRLPRDWQALGRRRNVAVLGWLHAETMRAAGWWYASANVNDPEWWIAQLARARQVYVLEAAGATRH